MFFPYKTFFFSNKINETTQWTPTDRERERRITKVLLFMVSPSMLQRMFYKRKKTSLQCIDYRYMYPIDIPIYTIISRYLLV